MTRSAQAVDSAFFQACMDLLEFESHWRSPGSAFRRGQFGDGPVAFAYFGSVGPSCPARGSCLKLHPRPQEKQSSF